MDTDTAVASNVKYERYDQLGKQRLRYRVASYEDPGFAKAQETLRRTA